MDDPRHERLREIFIAAVALPAQQRSGYLDDACGGDGALRAEVESMLARESANLFTECQGAELEELLPGEQVGHYRIIRRLGHGGMGVVFLAEQTAPLRRKVALKLVRLGRDTREVIRRFNDELQAVAMMDHPNVARALDAGVTDRGRPYFVMEYVDGEPITDCCARHRCTTDQRLELFIAVCEAVHHAHQKGVIHRDLKPSNILVTGRNGLLTPRVIDFGVAKATGGLQHAGSTRAGQLVGTLEYMSPEQAGRDPMDVDTRSDIYSLGVLLYEVLTGVHPLDLPDYACDTELQHAIRTVDPLPPSVRVRRLTGRSGDAAKGTGTSPTTARRLRGDLDGIVLKCLRKDRHQRYDSVPALAEDVRRHLRCETVSARPPTRLYRLGRFLDRHRIGATLCAIILITVVLGGAVSAALAVKSSRDAATALKIQQIFIDMLQAADPAREGTALTVAEALSLVPASAGAMLDENPLVEARIRSVIGTTSVGAGNIEHGMEHLRTALRLRREHLGDRHEDTHTSLNELVDGLLEAGGYDEARPLVEEALRLTRRYARETDLNALWARFNEIWLLGDADGVDVVPLLRELVADGRRALGPHHPAVTIAMIDLVEWLAHAGQLELAEELVEPTMRESVEQFGPSSEHTLALLRHHAMLLDWTGRDRDAIALQAEELELRRKQMGELHPETIKSMRELGDILHHAGELEEAERVFLNALELARRGAVSASWRLPLLERDYGELLIDLGRLEEALDYLHRGYEGLLALRGPAHPMTVNAIKGLARCYGAIGDEEEAARWAAMAGSG